MVLPYEPNHPLGDYELLSELDNLESFPIDTFDGKVHVEWDPQAAVTPLGQMPFFIDFLKTANLFEPWVKECPLAFLSNNASSKRDVLGTFLLSILSGHTRYAHITTLRSDHVNPPLLGMTKVVSEDAARRALKKIDETEGCAWLNSHLQKCYSPLLSTPWILDIDSTVKCLYGHQEGAEVGYNPTKPGRPSHTYHTYHIANIRLILDVEVEDGKSGAGCYSAKRLWSILDSIPKKNWPAFIRGDSSYGNENIMSVAETKGINYLFKLKCTRKIKQLIAHKMNTEVWEPVGQGWEGVDSEISLNGWTKSRRVVLLRRKLAKDKIAVTEKQKGQQLELSFVDKNTDVSIYEYQVLVTDLSEPISTMAQHYRDRADCENNFDELKNQWGWCGYTTQDFSRCRLIAKMIALIYNWWSIFTRLANPNSHLEAISSRPLLLNAVAKQTSHAGQSKLTITSTHGKTGKVSKILTAISVFFNKLRNTAEQLAASQRFHYILMIAFRKFIKESVQLDQDLLPRPG